jgi:hypothetical protein
LHPSGCAAPLWTLCSTELQTLSSRVILPAICFCLICNQIARFVIGNYLYWFRTLAFSCSLLLQLLLLVYRIFTLSIYIGIYTDNRFGQGLALAALHDWTQTPALLHPAQYLWMSQEGQFNDDQGTQNIFHMFTLCFILE